MGVAESRREKLRLRLAVHATAAMLTLVALPSTPSAASSQLGVYAGGGDPAGVAAFGVWLGAPPTIALDYLDWETWADIADTTWALDAWDGGPYRLVLSVPMLPTDGSTMSAGAAGTYDYHFVELANKLVSRGLGDSVIRLGWEFNHAYFPWYAGDDPNGFIAYWQSIVTAMRSVEGSDFDFEWAANLGGATFRLEDAYPGDAFVDFVGLDVYNHDWDPGWDDPVTRWSNLVTKSYGLSWHRSFAASHGKPTSFSEWGLIRRADGHGGGDDPFFIEQMHSWIEGGDTSFHIYFDVDTVSTTNSMTMGWFPQGALRFRELFGPLYPTPDVPPQAAPAAVVPPAPPRAERTVARPKPRVRVVIRRSKRQLRMAIGVRRAAWVRRVDVLIDGRRACRDRRKPFRCAVPRLEAGRYRITVRVHDRWRRKILLKRTVRMGGKARSTLILSTTTPDVARSLRSVAGLAGRT